MKKPNLDALMGNATKMTNEQLLHKKPAPQRKPGKRNER
jgi:hypothetical protein